ncbi:unnamed protein product [Calypogeia fissa]
MTDGEGMGSLQPCQILGDTMEMILGNRVSNDKDSLVGVDDGIGYLQISVVEGRNFEAKGDGQTFRPSVELQIGEHKVRTDTLKDTLSPSWLADFKLAVPSEDSQLWVSVINSDLLLDNESLVGKAAISVLDLLYSGTRVQWINMKDPNDKSVGEICLVLRYSNHQAPPSTAVSTSSETRDEHQYGLKALLCQCPPQASASHVRCISDDAVNIAHGDPRSSMIQDELVEDEAGTISPRGTLLEEVLPLTLGSPVLQKKSLVEEADKSSKGVHCPKSEISCGDSQPCSGQHRMVAFAGALVAILAAMTWGSKFCKKRAEDQEKKGSPGKLKQ